MVFKTLVKSLRQYKKQAIQSPALVACEVLVECFIPLIMSQLIDEMKGGSLSPIIKYGSILIVMALVSLLFGFLAGKIAATASCGFAKNLRQDLFYKVQDFAFPDIDKFSSSSLVTRLTTDVTNVQNAFQIIIRIAVRTPLMLVFSIIMSFTINTRMTFIFVALVPVLGIGLFCIIFKVFPIFRKIFKKYDALNNSVQENVAGIRDVKSYVREDYEKERFGKSALEVRDDFTKAEKIIAFSNPIMTFCIFAALLLVSYFGARMIISSTGVDLTAGELSSLIVYGMQSMIAMMMLSMVFVMILISSESSKRIVEVLTHSSSLVSPEKAVTEISDGSIEYKSVTFKYSENAEKNALENINLSIRSGETIGILGSTGSAKTTLIQLIPRLYDVTEGSLLVGGRDVREYDLETLRNEVAVVLQKNVLFAGTVKENLRWGNKDATDEEIERVCKLAQADEFIQQMPEKYDTFIEQGGTNVSGGQKQRLCIARAILKKPKILIFDDSTSAVDTKTDAFIRNAMHKEIPDTTKIIIAQRVSSVEDANRIIVMENGRIKEIGSHKELIELNGIYKEMYELQTMAKEVNDET